LSFVNYGDESLISSQDTFKVYFLEMLILKKKKKKEKRKKKKENQ